MWTLRRMFLLVAAAVAIAGVVALGRAEAGRAQEQAPTSGITVTGEGEVRARPDVAMVTVGVVTRADSARAAMDENSRTMSAVVRAIMGLGVPERDIQTSGISLSPITADPRSGEAPRIVGFQATNSVAASITPPERAGEVLDAAIGAGANQAFGVRFTLRDTNSARDQAVQMASRAARSRAEAVASALGVSLGRVVSVVEETAGGPVPVREVAMGAPMAAQAPPVQPGELSVIVRVRATFEISG